MDMNTHIYHKLIIFVYEAVSTLEDI